MTIIYYYIDFWDVHQGYRVLTHTQFTLDMKQHELHRRPGMFDRSVVIWASSIVLTSTLFKHRRRSPVSVVRYVTPSRGIGGKHPEVMVKVGKKKSLEGRKD